MRCGIYIFLLAICAKAAEKHWAFQPFKKPALPAVKDATWVRNSIDRFVLARMEAAGVRPAEAAKKGTLLRRLSLDLIGVPPTPA